MRARQATFIASASEPASFPKPGAPEIAFSGRSNVGKSSLINALTAFKGLARTSSTPGRTRLLNWFKILPPQGPELAFVDLPGYGYAKVSKDMRAGFRHLVEGYVQLRGVLKLVIVIVDARRGPEDEERELIEWLAHLNVPSLVVLTKADKLSKSERFPVAKATRKALGLTRDPIMFSASDGDGIDDLWRAIIAAV